MDFHDSPEDAAFRAELRRFLDSVAVRQPVRSATGLRLLTEDPDDSEAVAVQRRWQKTLADGGWGAPTWPEAYGGRDAGPVQAMIFHDELAHYDIPALVMFVVGLGMAGPTLMEHGSDAQRRRWIPPIIDGSEIWCQLWSEPDSGSDLASVKTKAVPRDGGSWVVTGQKVWTTGAHHAKWGLCLLRTDPTLPKHRGLSVFVIDMHAPGVTVRPVRQITGGADFNEVFLDEVVVPADHLVGDVNDGWRVALTTLMNERYTAGGGDATELMEPLLRLAFRHDGIAADVRQELARMWIVAKLVTVTGYRHLTTLSKGGQVGPEGSVLKIARTDVQIAIADMARHLLGVEALVNGPTAPDGGMWSTAAFGMVASKIAGGTDDIMRNIIGERLLGLPKEPA